MGVYHRPDSPFWWLLLERPGQKPIREKTKIPVDGGSPPLSKELKRQAQEAYGKRMSDLASGDYRLARARDSRTFETHRTWYATHVTAHHRGASRELSVLKYLGAYFDRYELRAIDHELAREWRTWRAKAVSSSTIRREEQVLKAILNTAVPKYLEHNPLNGFKSLRATRTDTRILSHDEETRLLLVLPSDEARTLVICALDTLLRLSNVRNLTRQQDHGRHLFSDTKVDAIRIPISTRLRKALDARPKGSSFFPSYAGPSNNHTLRMFMAACKLAKVATGRKTGGISFHCLRHTGASRMLEAGADVKTVMELGGWKNLKVMERYLHPTEDRRLAAVNSVGQHASITPNGDDAKSA
ncbi:MAG: site-specific integrase [Vicinamibacterales bacterium]